MKFTKSTLGQFILLPFENLLCFSVAIPRICCVTLLLAESGEKLSQKTTCVGRFDKVKTKFGHEGFQWESSVRSRTRSRAKKNSDNGDARNSEMPDDSMDGIQIH